jgi:hypothetical protein
MFPYPIATPQGCNIQTFYGSASQTQVLQFSWNKPVGVSHVYMLLIGAGGNGDGTSGGGSGSVTVWYGAAQHVPNNLIIQPALPNAAADTDIYFNSRSTTVRLLRAASGSGTAGGGGLFAPVFAASGFYSSNTGQDGTTDDPVASPTTFLAAGTGNGGLTNTANYGYQLINSGGSTNRGGVFQMQPIIVGTGGKTSGAGGVGCGGGYNSGIGGPGMVLIASW